MSEKQSERFYEILDVIKKLHNAKRHDYGDEEDEPTSADVLSQEGLTVSDFKEDETGDKANAAKGL